MPPGIMLLQNFMAASRKRNLARFRLFANNQDTSWIDDAPLNPVTVISVTYNPNMVIDTSVANVITLVLTGNVLTTVLNYNGGSPTTGTTVTLRIVQDAVGGHQFALPTNLSHDQEFVVDPGENRVTLLPLQYSINHWEFWSDPFSFPLAGVDIDT